MENEDQSRRPVLVRPCGQFDHRVEDTLHAMDYDGPRAALDVENTLDAQQIVAVNGYSLFEPGVETFERKRIGEANGFS